MRSPTATEKISRYAVLRETMPRGCSTLVNRRSLASLTMRGVPGRFRRDLTYSRNVGQYTLLQTALYRWCFRQRGLSRAAARALI
jgi:hypothetical protein